MLVVKRLVSAPYKKNVRKYWQQTSNPSLAIPVCVASDKRFVVMSVQLVNTCPQHFTDRGRDDDTAKPIIQSRQVETRCSFTKDADIETQMFHMKKPLQQQLMQLLENFQQTLPCLLKLLKVL